MAPQNVSRRSFMKFGLLTGGAAVAAAPALARAMCEASAPDMQGPYYLGNPPLSYDTGSGLKVSGVVREADSCGVIAGATIERWHSNPFGIYEDAYRCRMVSDAEGKYSFTSVMPGLYGGLQRHVHFKFSAPGYKDLITQRYLEDENPAPTAEFDVYLEKT